MKEMKKRHGMTRHTTTKVGVFRAGLSLLWLLLTQQYKRVQGLTGTYDIKSFSAQKTTALRIPAWSPTVVLTERHSG